MEMKNCSKCKIAKDLSEFSKDRSRNDGLSNACRGCKRVKNDVYRGHTDASIIKRRSVKPKPLKIEDVYTDVYTDHYAEIQKRIERGNQLLEHKEEIKNLLATIRSNIKPVRLKDSRFYCNLRCPSGKHVRTVANMITGSRQCKICAAAAHQRKQYPGDNPSRYSVFRRH